MIVMKFGGTSVESAAAIERVAGIIRPRFEQRPLVVVSAMGKTTNKLLAAADKAAAGNLADALRDAEDLRGFHHREAGQVIPSESSSAMEMVLENNFEALETTLEAIATAGHVTPVLWDEICSYGERLSSALVALALPAFGLPAAHLDARSVLITDSRHTQALPLYSRTYARFKEKAVPLLQGRVVVMGGFIGATSDGVTTTLGRGGSDFSAAIAGAGIGAEEIQIWTDVDGMLTCDPRVLPGGHLVKNISFAEAAELAYFGAKVLHPATVQPAIEKNIPVRILNSRRPDVAGTLIVSDNVECRNSVKSIACKCDITVVNIRSLRMLMAHGFLRRIFEVFDRYRTPVDMVSTSEVSVSLTIDHTQSLGDIEAELSKIAEVTVVPNQAIICLVGDALRETPGIAKRIFSALEQVNIRMISQGASLLNVSVVVDGADLVRGVEALHREFFRDLDPEVFQ
ncbi:lysine-sensitive aspartokinase 3 [uncultured Paludibaculum sp.]|uniref:lysine-sensitive aspartokinase 3 n=1 Tax=uncultured Paludibaculum sp. TaxID=1765020 RepID=UPI002AABCE9A|nr:lysine-sensitive aspartokinase 3 [uncultured Paludibaculum sp.]